MYMVLSYNMVIENPESVLQNEELKIFKHVFEKAGWGIAIGKENLIELDFVNKEFARILGYDSTDELKNKNILKLFPEEEKSNIVENIEKIHQIGNLNFEAKLLKKDGTKIVALLSVSAIKNEEGKVLRRFVHLQDITNQKEQEVIGRIQHELSSELNTTNDLNKLLTIIVKKFRELDFVDLSGIYLNDKSKKELKLAAHDGDFDEKSLAEVLTYKEGTTQYELVHQKKPVYTTYDQLSATMDVRMHNVKALYIVPIIYDNELIAVTNLASTKYSEVRDQDKEVIETISSMLGSIIKRSQYMHDRELMQNQLMLSTKLASIGELAASIAHEINNPLSIVKGNLELVTEAVICSSSDEKMLAKLNRMDDAINRIQSIVSSLKKSVHSDDASDKRVNLIEVLTETVSMLEIIYKKENIEFVLDFSKETEILVGTSFGKLQQIFFNLFSNSKDAMRSKNGGQVTLSITREDENVIMKIADTGEGIKKENFEKVFDSFYTSKPRGAGTGIGLNIVLTIVKEMNAEVSVDSELGFGTVFKFIIPIVQVFSGDDTEKNVNSYEQLGGKALLVDDESDILDVLALYINNFGIETCTFNNAADAINSLKQEKYDYIISDIMMPEMNGIEFIDSAKEQQLIDNEIVLYITGGIVSEYSEEIRKSIPKNSQGLIHKPFNMNVIYSCLKECLEKKK